MFDKDGFIFHQGDEVKFHSQRRGHTMPAVVVSDHLLGKMVEVKIAQDPFTSWVERDKIQVTSRKGRKRREHTMPTKTAPSAKELRKQAKALNIEGWEEMERDELADAIAEAEEADDEVEDEEVEEDDEDEEPAPRARKATKTAKKSTKASKTRPATKKASKKAAPAKAKRAADDDEDEETDNPFRSGSNLWHMTEALLKGGKRSTMVARLQKKIDLKPRVRGGKNYDVAEEIDYRLVRVCQLLTNEHGFVIEKDGRGKDQTVRAIPPSEQ